MFRGPVPRGCASSNLCHCLCCKPIVQTAMSVERILACLTRIFRDYTWLTSPPRDHVNHVLTCLRAVVCQRQCRIFRLHEPAYAGPTGQPGFCLSIRPQQPHHRHYDCALSFSARLLSVVTGATQKQWATSCTCICCHATQSCLCNILAYIGQLCYLLVTKKSASGQREDADPRIGQVQHATTLCCSCADRQLPRVRTEPPGLASAHLGQGAERSNY